MILAPHVPVRLGYTVNVLEFGAIPNDKAPNIAAGNWTAFRRAFDALASRNVGGIIYFPPGIYYFTSGDPGLALTQIVDAFGQSQGILVKGEAGMATILEPVDWATGPATKFINVTGICNLQVRNLLFQRWDSVIYTTGGGTWIDGMMHHCWFTGTRGPVIDAVCASVRIESNVWDVPENVGMRLKVGTEYVVIRGNLFFDQENLMGGGTPGLPTIDLAGTNFDTSRFTAVQDVLIEGNVFYQSAQQGEPLADSIRSVKINGSRGVNVRGNFFSKIEGHGIEVGASAASKDVLIEGNVFEPRLDDATYCVSGQPIRITTSANQTISVRGNKIRVPRLTGIQVEGPATDVVIDGNTVVGSETGHGIGVSGTNGVLVANNVTHDNVGCGIKLNAVTRGKMSNNASWNNDSTNIGGTEGLNQSNYLVDGGSVDIEIGENLGYTVSGLFAHYNLLLNGVTRPVVKGNFFSPYRTAPIDIRSATNPVIDQGSNFIGLTGVIQLVGADASFTVDPLASQRIINFDVALTGAKTFTLPTDVRRIFPGMQYRVMRRGAGAGTLTIQNGISKAIAVDQWADCVYDGAAWKLVSFGSL